MSSNVCSKRISLQFRSWICSPMVAHPITKRSRSHFLGCRTLDLLVNQLNRFRYSSMKMMRCYTKYTPWWKTSLSQWMRRIDSAGQSLPKTVKLTKLWISTDLTSARYLKLRVETIWSSGFLRVSNLVQMLSAKAYLILWMDLNHVRPMRNWTKSRLLLLWQMGTVVSKTFTSVSVMSLTVVQLPHQILFHCVLKAQIDSLSERIYRLVA